LSERREKRRVKKVSYPPWSDADKSWYCLVNQGWAPGSWSRGEWFPKKVCNLYPSKIDPHAAWMTMPEWLYNKIFK
jgi:hypothetical protein